MTSFSVIFVFSSSLFCTTTQPFLRNPTHARTPFPPFVNFHPEKRDRLCSFFFQILVGPTERIGERWPRGLGRVYVWER
ncbi:hypothetical protein PSV08DRAFT_269244 [Bipolaris maydis]|uniref:uncharacterized protein n=1 Tax=Cochliobolus heterostrophus TaxID=5016 RepID=UPI0024D8EB91|nr:hypothetical protein J3E73DRAFT_274403 [Bipolaris maydis]KAJ6275026.1 hypothetical protein PSV08DRAFT_269244 [Bipolaris maydis]